jgi:hypothetical protein
MTATTVAIIASVGMGVAAGQSNGTTEPSGPSEPATHLKPYLPPLHLTGAQQKQISASVAGRDTEVTFQLKDTKPHKDFAPKLGEKVPPALHAHALPTVLTQKLPQLADYKYMKVKGQVLIVNPMTHKIVSLFPEQQG